MAIWSYLEPGYNSATGHSVWLVRSPGTVYHLTFVRHLHYQRSKWCSRHICFFDPTSVTNCFPEYEQRTMCGALVVTLAMLLCLINCRFIIIIIIAEKPIVMLIKSSVSYEERLHSRIQQFWYRCINVLSDLISKPVQLYGARITRKIKSCWRESSTGLHACFQSWRTCHMNNGLPNWNYGHLRSVETVLIWYRYLRWLKDSRLFRGSILSLGLRTE